MEMKKRGINKINLLFIADPPPSGPRLHEVLSLSLSLPADDDGNDDEIFTCAADTTHKAKEREKGEQRRDKKRLTNKQTTQIIALI